MSLDAPTRFECEATLRCDKYGIVWSAAIVPAENGRVRIVTACDNLRVWDRTGCLQILRDDRDDRDDLKPYCVVALPNGHIASSCRNRGKIKTFDLSEGRCLRSLMVCEELVWPGTRITALPNGRVVSCALGQLKIWDVDEGRCLTTLNLGMNFGDNALPLLALTNDRIIYACPSDGPPLDDDFGPRDHDLKLLELADKCCLMTYTGHEDAITCVALRDGKVISSSLDCTIKIWSFTTGDCLSTIECWTEGRDNQGVTCFLALPGDAVVAGFWYREEDGDYGEMKSWDLKTGRCLETLATGLEACVFECFVDLPHDHRFVAASQTGNCTVWVDRPRELEKLTSKQVGRQRACDDVTKTIAAFL